MSVCISSKQDSTKDENLQFLKTDNDEDIDWWFAKKGDNSDETDDKEVDENTMKETKGKKDEEVNRLGDKIEDMADAKYYGCEVDDLTFARQQGKIYDPASFFHESLSHNWGLNVAWALALTRMRVPIRLISSLKGEYAFRTNPPDENEVPGPHPSAFALEIAIADKMGYELNFFGNRVMLNPPPESYSMTMVAKKVVLPTKQEQIDIYTFCSYLFLSYTKQRSVSSSDRKGAEFQPKLLFAMCDEVYLKYTERVQPEKTSILEILTKKYLKN